MEQQQSKSGAESLVRELWLLAWEPQLGGGAQRRILHVDEALCL